MHYKSILAIAVSLTCISATAARWYDRAGAVHWTADSTLDNGPVPDDPRVVRGLPVDLCTVTNNNCKNKDNLTPPVVAAPAAAPSAPRSWTSYFPNESRIINLSSELAIKFSIDSRGHPSFSFNRFSFYSPIGEYCEADSTCPLPTPEDNTEIVLRDCGFGPWKYTAKPILIEDRNNHIPVSLSFKKAYEACPAEPYQQYGQ